MSRWSDNPSPGEAAPRRVLVFRALQLGDMLCAVPALRALRRAWPHAEIVLAGLPWARSFAARFGHLVDGFREFPGYPGLPEITPDVRRIPGFLAEIQSERFDLAIQMHGSGPFVNELTALFAARRSAGFCLPGGYRPDPEGFITWPDSGLELRRLMRLAEHLGAPSAGEDLEFPLTADDLRAADEIDEVRGLAPGSFACLHAGASVPERRWPAAHFAAAAKHLDARGLRVVLTGTAAEGGLAREVADRAGVPCVDLTGRTDLGAVGVLLRRSRLLVCNDTGVSHVAAALRVPSVVISTGDNPARWAPVDASLHRVLCRDPGVGPGEAIDQIDHLLRSKSHWSHREADRCVQSAS
ncbi:glycosyltransferase family 9 protein [Tundrisphaera sp. TA3]|uniref:glycosyltransferase family 9 protein n=1 Tax=Tundrisphaera sp. TA3 TaxID=3435775 RepID=UPI003EBC437F